MAIYTTIDDLTKRLDPQVLAGLADDVNTPAELGDAGTIAVLNRAISDGAALIDGYLLGLVDLANPFVAASLERLNATLALYFLYRRRYVDDRLNPLSASRDMVVAHLLGVAQSRERVADGAEGQPELVVFSTTENRERVFSEESLARF